METKVAVIQQLIAALNAAEEELLKREPWSARDPLIAVRKQVRSALAAVQSIDYRDCSATAELCWLAA